MNLFKRFFGSRPTGDDLINAAMLGDMPTLRALLDRGAGVNARDSEGMTALLLASREGHSEVVQALFAKGGDVNAEDNNSWSALTLASDEGHSEVVQALLTKGACINARTSKLDTALIVASSKGHCKVVQALLEAGADVRTKNSKGETALIVASSNGYCEVVQALLEAGADVRTKNSKGKTARMVASSKGHREVAQALREKSADVDAKLKSRGGLAFPKTSPASPPANLLKVTSVYLLSGVLTALIPILVIYLLRDRIHWLFGMMRYDQGWNDTSFWAGVIGPIAVATEVLVVAAMFLFGLGVVFSYLPLAICRLVPVRRFGSFVRRETGSCLLAVRFACQGGAFVGVMLTFLVGIFAIGCVWERSDREGPARAARAIIPIEHAFSRQVATLTETTDLVPAPESHPPCLRGKAIVIDRRNSDLPDQVIEDAFWHAVGRGNLYDDSLKSQINQLGWTGVPRVSIASLRLPETTRAIQPAEARTVVLLDWRRIRLPFYWRPVSGTGAQVEGYSVECTLSIIDRGGHLYWMDVAKFEGDNPNDTVAVNPKIPGIYGPVPYDGIEQYLRALPRFTE